MRSGQTEEIGEIGQPLVSSDQAAAALLHVLVTVAIIIRIALPPTLLNQFINYSTETGAIYEKIHPGSYLILLLLPLALTLRPLRIFSGELPAVRALVFYTVSVGLTALLLIPMGRAGSAGYFIDTYMVAGAAGLLLYTQSPGGRLRIAGTLIVVLAFSALLGIVEAVTHVRVLPYDYVELEFRPTGLAGHPLMMGLLSCAAIGFTWAMPWRARWRLAAIALLTLGTIAAEARFATIAAGITGILIILLSNWNGFTRRQQRRGKLFVLLFVSAFLIPALVLLQAAGFLNRLNEGLIDQSTMARIDVYKVFGYVSLRDILFGADIEWITRIINDELGIEINESTPVVLTFQLGLPGALGFSALVAFLFWRLCCAVGTPERLATVSFFVIALSNITLSTKTSAVLVIVVLLVALQKSRANLPSH